MEFASTVDLACTELLLPRIFFDLLFQPLLIFLVHFRVVFCELLGLFQCLHLGANKAFFGRRRRGFFNTPDIPECRTYQQEKYQPAHLQTPFFRKAIPLYDYNRRLFSCSTASAFSSSLSLFTTSINLIR